MQKGTYTLIGRWRDSRHRDNILKCGGAAIPVLKLPRVRIMTSAPPKSPTGSHWLWRLGDTITHTCDKEASRPRLKNPATLKTKREASKRRNTSFDNHDGGRNAQSRQNDKDADSDNNSMRGKGHGRRHDIQNVDKGSRMLRREYHTTYTSDRLAQRLRRKDPQTDSAKNEGPKWKSKDLDNADAGHSSR